MVLKPRVGEIPKLVVVFVLGFTNQTCFLVHEAVDMYETVVICLLLLPFILFTKKMFTI